jgi:leader peptidase (prepilin peptidase)/N-methyltransferase
MLFGAVFVCVYYAVLVGRGVTIESFSWLLYYTLFVVVLGAITLYDLKHKMIPSIFFIIFLVLSCITMIVRFVVEQDPYIFLSPIVIALPFGVAYLITKGKALGFGDILMYIAVGGFLSILEGLAVLILSVWIGGIVGIILHLKNRKTYSMKTALPFVPFITLAFLIVLFTGIDISSIGHILTWWYY